jgi:DNA-binding CsgD family transcriptional regulator
MPESVWWQADQLAVIERALSVAAEGRPALVTIEGAAGMGKSTMVREVGVRAHGAGFESIRAEARHLRMAEPFSLLRDLGIETAHIEPTTDPFQAAQALRERVDRVAGDHPVLLLVDDLQWADRESVEALTWLLRRADGERLLVVLATRPPSARTGEAWRRIQEGAGARGEVDRIDLEGLSRELTGRLVRACAPDADNGLIDRLWRHTEGNPLYLQTLLREYDAAQLRELDDLPAPAELTRAITARLQGMDPDAVTLVRAVATLGDAWSPLPRAVEVAGLEQAGESVGLLEGEGLLLVMGSGPHTRIRIPHSVIRAAVYQEIPIGERQDLHRQAAMTSGTRLEALRHRFAATDGYDDRLADDLAAAARARHSELAHRESARLLDWAADVTGEPARREGRRLDAIFELALARDVDEVSARLEVFDGDVDGARRALARGFELVVRRQWVKARDVLDAVSAETLRDAGAETRYRLLTMRAWAGAVTGRPGRDVLADLERAERDGGHDDALAAYAVLARRQGERQTSDDAQQRIRPLPQFQPHQHLSRSELYELGWAGGLYALRGDLDPAVRCLLRFTESLRSGPRDPSEGGYRALLGYAQWMKGDWEAAGVNIRLASESRLGTVHPMAASVGPLARIALGDLAGARSAAAQSRIALMLAPWSPAVQVALGVEVLLRQQQDDPAARRRLWDDLAAELDLEHALSSDHGTLPLTGLHLGLVHIWAGHLEEAGRRTGEIEGCASSLLWAEGAGAWLRGLTALARDDPASAREPLQAAVRGLVTLPLHSAHAATDLARACSLLGDATTASQARAAAVEAYSRLGLHDHARRLSPSPEPVAIEDPLAPLSDRERDVVALLAAGMSYAQIARELYVSRSTVAFHLGNVYAKTDTTSRHELVDLIHAQQPA